MNTKGFRLLMLSHDDTQEKLAESIGMSLSSLNQRINGKVDFRQREIFAIKKRYSLTDKEVAEIFFDEKVS